ncbi:MAG: UDP-2,3-diacylglucosamine diphosphatase [Gammaproteobacteria bacterium]|nr:UDP-2,3-diacylglucosamine diphosphatase [Gammaproteobacteria bacterium]
MSETLFISDLHLHSSRPEITRLFLDFLAKQCPRADALYILGDLFEVWLGDDDNSADNLTVLSALKNLADLGTPVYVMHGNRDFLMGKTFATNSHCTLLNNDHDIIDLYGTPTLIMHGDTLCTDDIDYLKFRQQVRNPAWQEQMLAMPLAQRAAIAKSIREQNEAAKGDKAYDIMDVNQTAVEEEMLKNNVTHLIHGHTHRPNVHEFTVNGQSMQRIVLGDWYEQGSVLRCNQEGCRLETL